MRLLSIFKRSPKAPGRSTPHRPGALHVFEAPEPRAELRAWSLTDLAEEVLARLANGQTFEQDKDVVRAGQLHDMLESRLNVHLNRFAPRRYYDVVCPVLNRLPPAQFQGATIVDLGSGSLNPYAFGFLFLMLGARRAYTIDLEPVQDVGRAVRALATAAGWLLVNPTSIVGPHTIDATAMIGNLEGFDLSRLACGDPHGMALDRLVARTESVYDLSLGDAEADLVSSVSLLEHLDRIDDALDSMHRITKPGGVGHHVVDFIDHRFYIGEANSPLSFLELDSAEPLVHGSNRIRCHQLCERFVRHGFVVEHVHPSRIDPVSEGQQRGFVEPYRSMSREELSIVCATIVVRRR